MNRELRNAALAELLAREAGACWKATREGIAKLAAARRGAGLQIQMERAVVCRSELQNSSNSPMEIIVFPLPPAARIIPLGSFAKVRLKIQIRAAFDARAFLFRSPKLRNDRTALISPAESHNFVLPGWIILASRCSRRVLSRIAIQTRIRIFLMFEPSFRPIFTGRKQLYVRSDKMMNRHVALDQKLIVLQKNDPFRRWHSLDERRVCISCDRRITGRMIDVWQDQRGSYHFHCPTPGCLATLRDWSHHGPTAHARAGTLRARPRVGDMVSSFGKRKGISYARD